MALAGVHLSKDVARAQAFGRGIPVPTPVDVDGVTVARWRRYGKDRLYVSGTSGQRLGWYDLTTGESHVEQAEWVQVFHEAVVAWRSGQAAPAAPVVSDCEDLAARRAGAMAREQAVALREAAPVRTLVARVLRVHTDERAWRLGADGEEKVAAQLDKLARKDPRWRRLHAIPVGENGADIDHLVVGPGGVYTLNTKHHRGAKIWVAGDTFMVNGVRHPYVRNSRHEARRASRLLAAASGLPVGVAGIVVPVGADEVTIRTEPSDVHVVNRLRLVSWLRSRREVLDERTIVGVYEAARRSTTWIATGR